METAIPRTWAEAERLPAHWSAFRRRLEQLAGGKERVTGWLVTQANLRGFFGAVEREPAPGGPCTDLDLEDLVVACLMPHAELDHRVIKLVVRMLQSGQVDPARLAFKARRERADVALAWVLDLVPPEEVNDALRAITAALRPPRGRRDVHYRYDPQRLVKRPASSERLWRAKPR